LKQNGRNDVLSPEMHVFCLGALSSHPLYLSYPDEKPGQERMPLLSGLGHPFSKQI
jgi:hypothetical protein